MVEFARFYLFGLLLTIFVSGCVSIHDNMVIEPKKIYICDNDSVELPVYHGINNGKATYTGQCFKL